MIHQTPRLAKRRVGWTIAFACLTVTISGCDLSATLGLTQPALQSFSILASNNPSLPANETARIEGTDVWITLPWQPVESGMSLTPTVVLGPGCSIAPNGAYALKDGMSLSVSGCNAGGNAVYVLHVGVTASTAPSPPAFSAVVSFVFQASRNPVLAVDSSAVVVGTNLYVSLPGSVLSSGTSLVPTVSLTQGYSLSPSGSFAPKDGESLVVTDTATGVQYQYTLHVSALSGSSASGVTSLLESFVVTRALNPVLSADAGAVIDGSDLYLSLPESVMANGTKLTPTVTLQPGYSISPSGSYAMTDGMPLVITQASTGATTSYGLHIGATTGSLSFLTLAGPFSTVSNVSKQDLTPFSTLSYDPPSTTYTLTLHTDSFSALFPYVAAGVQNILAGAIGFATAQVPYNASVTGLAQATSGAVPPYAVGVSPADGGTTTTYRVVATRTPSSQTPIVSTSVVVRQLYSWTTSSNWDPSLATWLSQAAYQTGGYNGNENVSLSNDQVYFLDNGAVSGLDSSDDSVAATVGTSVSAVEANNFAFGAALDSSFASGIEASQTATTINNGVALIFNAGASYSAPAATSVADTSGTFSVSGVVNLLVGVAGRSGTTYTASSEALSATETFPIENTESFSALPYFQVTQFVLVVPSAVNIASVMPINDVSNFTIQNGTPNNSLTVNLVAPTSRVVASIATVSLQAEDGTVNNVTLAIQ